MIGEKPHLYPLMNPLGALQQLLEKYKGRSIIIGGVASSLLGKPRLTADLDALILMRVDELPDLINNAEMVGFEGRIPDVLKFAQRNRIVLLLHEETGTNIDISMGLLPFEDEMVSRAQQFQIGELILNLPTPEDLIILKAVAHRPKDLLDIQGIIDNHKVMDYERIENWIKQFAELLGKPEIWEDIEKMF